MELLTAHLKQGVSMFSNNIDANVRSIVSKINIQCMAIERFNIFSAIGAVIYSGILFICLLFAMLARIVKFLFSDVQNPTTKILSNVLYQWVNFIIIRMNDSCFQFVYSSEDKSYRTKIFIIHILPIFFLFYSFKLCCYTIFELCLLREVTFIGWIQLEYIILFVELVIMQKPNGSLWGRLFMLAEKEN